MCFVVCVLSQSWGSWRVLCSGVILLRVWGAGQGRRGARAGLGWAWVSVSSPVWVPCSGAVLSQGWDCLFSIWEAGKQGRGSGVVQSHPDARLLKSQASAGLWDGSCSTAELPRAFSPPSCTAGAFLSLTQGLYQQLCKEREKTAFTEGSLVSWGLGWVDLEYFYGWGHSGTKPDIVFWVELINAQKIQTWVWLLCSKKQHNTVREYKKKLSSANIIYIGNGYSAPWNNFKKSGLKTAIPGNTIWLIPTKVLDLLH